MKNVYLTIIGGGASGLMCASAASKRLKNKDILIIEKENRVGKKILVTGNGRCNLSNLNASANDYNLEAKELINNLFNKYNSDYVINYFKSIGLITKPDSDGRVYPRNKLASSVLNVIRNELNSNHVIELCDTNIIKINKRNDGYEIISNNGNFFTQKLVIATGGICDHAGRETNSSREICSLLNLKTTSYSPSLSPIPVKNQIIKSLNGIRMEGKVSLIINNKLIKEENGEIQFTKNALSGICIFNLSRYANQNDNSIIRVSLLPEYDNQELYKFIKNRTTTLANEKIENALIGLFHKNIISALLKECNINNETKCCALSDTKINHLANKINNWDFHTIKKTDYKNSQVTAGGIRLSEINNCTLESKNNKNLYIIGESLNVDGNCGGFNLQFAFACGLCVGENI